MHILFLYFRYNTLFRFLLTVKRVQIELQRSFAPLIMQKKRVSELERAKIYPLWLLRSKMAFLIDNLYFYLHVK